MMFAVPGWSLGELKPAQDQPNPRSSTSRKRKRKERTEREARETKKGNEGRNTVPEAQKQRLGGSQNHKDAKNSRDTVEQTAAGHDPKAGHVEPHKGAKETKKAQKKQREELESKNPHPAKRLKETTKTVTNPQPPKPPQPRGSMLTPLQNAMRQKLSGARFRHLNEMLYTSSSDKARTLIESDPTIFDEYHSGFRQQVSTWPENPVESYVRDLIKRGKNRGSGKATGSAGDAGLPRTKGICSVADCGCGDAALAQKLSKDASKLAVNVLSYDLHNNSALVTKADIARLPLPDGSVNVAIFCLALMGTNWMDFIEEAWRVLHWKGELWIAEIKSRFTKPRKQQVVDHSVGKRRKKGAQKPAEDDEDQNETLRAHVDGESRQSSETDVSAFVQVLQRRGFSLQREGGIDMRNKMFVKMRFLKDGVPNKGKHCGQASIPSHGTKGQRAPTELGGEGDSFDEPSVLKPCLYKVR